MKCVGKTDVGIKRKNNQDSFCIVDKNEYRHLMDFIRKTEGKRKRCLERLSSGKRIYRSYTSVVMIYNIKLKSCL